jgi:hypothetical protein
VPEPPILQVEHQRVTKNAKYDEQLKKARINNQETALKLYLTRVE